MSSRLFHTVVAFGIALGAQGAACLGDAVDAAPPVEPAEGGAGPATEDATADARASDTGSKGAVDGAAATGDGGASDAPRDVILDAFCDAAWPTTKATPGGPTCGAVDACKDAGAPPHCFTLTSETPLLTCDSRAVLPAWCGGGGWRCTAGSVTEDACKCWKNRPCP